MSLIYTYTLEELKKRPILKLNTTGNASPNKVLMTTGIGLHRDWQEDDRWFCSELIPYICMQGGTNLFNPKFVHRIVPQHLLMLPSKVIDASY